MKQIVQEVIMHSCYMSIVSMFDVVDTKEKGRCRKQNEQEKGCVACVLLVSKTACREI